MPPPPVFLSYARSASRAGAQALHAALEAAGVPAFLDSVAIENGEQFPRALADGVLGANVVVVFAHEVYFRRWYCLRELALALAPFEACRRRRFADAAGAAEALAPVVVALPDGTPPSLDSLPPGLRTQSWPTDTAALVALVQARLAAGALTIRERLGDDSVARELVARLQEEAALPAAQSLGGIRGWHSEVPITLNTRFVGRADDLWRIHFCLAALRGDSPMAVGVTGALEAGGGFGKTRLAAEYVHRYGRGYTGGIFWLNADAGDGQLEGQHHAALEALQHPAPTPSLRELREQGVPVAARLRQAVEAVPPEQPVLFVVDNVPEPPPGAPPRDLAHYCPAVGRATVLATSRAHLAASSQEVVGLAVDELAPAAAIRLLRNEVPQSGAVDENGWRDVARWVGCLPFALELLNAGLRLGAVTAPELVTRARQRSPAAELDGLREVLRHEVPAGKLRGVTEALALSHERLPVSAQHLAQLLAQLAPDPIPEEILARLGADASPAARAALVNRSVIIRVDEGPIPTFGRMHRLMGAFLRAHASAGVLIDQIAEVLLVVFDADRCRVPTEWPALRASVPHAQEILSRLIERRAALGVVMAKRLGILFGELNLLSEARAVETRGCQLARDTLGEDDHATLEMQANLAGTMTQQLDYQAARQLSEGVLYKMRGLLGTDDPRTLRVQNNFAVLLAAMGDHPGARKLREAVLEKTRRLFCDDDLATLDAQAHLAVSLNHDGDYQGARELEEVVLRKIARLRGEDHPDTLRAQGNLAVTLSKQGDHHGARKLEEVVLERRLRLLGEDHPDTLRSMRNLAATLAVLGDHAGASALRARADAAAKARG